MATKKSPLSKAAQERIKTYEARSNQQESRSGVKRRDNRVAIIAGLVALAIALGSQLGYSALHQTATASATPSAGTRTTCSATRPRATPSPTTLATGSG